MTSRRTHAVLLVGSTLGLVACRAQQDVPEGIRPELSALPPEMRAAEQQQAATVPARGGETWNAANIDWQPYEAGLARAKAQNKPVCLVFYTNWCPHCRNYSHVFDDPKVVERAKSFVMVRANADDEQALATKFTKDGGYVPRTFFLGPDGTFDPEIHAARTKFMYFYDERDASSILGGMEAALRRFAK